MPGSQILTRSTFVHLPVPPRQTLTTPVPDRTTIKPLLTAAACGCAAAWPNVLRQQACGMVQSRCVMASAVFGINSLYGKRLQAGVRLLLAFKAWLALPRRAVWLLAETVAA
jgi:hypothetical protein